MKDVLIKKFTKEQKFHFILIIEKVSKNKKGEFYEIELEGK